MHGNKPKVYCLDSNALIEPWNKYYSPKISNYFDILERLIIENRIFCTEEVALEIKKGDDLLYKWLKKNESNFVKTIDSDVQKKVRIILSQFPNLIDSKKQRSMADPWVIAHAWSLNAVVVTKEYPIDNVKKHCKIPDVCKFYNICCMDDWQFIAELGITFVASL
ncbi:DUF4411 family protein [Candidatus Cloacimonas acidaminovorans]|jgi:predicted nucleic acid-binding protein|uniref:PIN domain-containing protein n=1 Tax=Cloacimonas acidaminovorans (strain Evry) TaxID=459349 RepID=B0VF79_CLOAI|nr:DUF4411 family protein [Candidatus Cloacimonas acidaminovorans]CAO80131.1 conserved hypothetical protein [Candidatus Cloacimonas acidaminovorans str. Evry]